MSLAFVQITHHYEQQPVLHDVTLAAEPGEILCLLGPSGGGKSTLLRIAAGLLPVQSGEVRLDGALLAAPGRHPPPEARPVGLVFQDYVLFPHRTVAENVAFGLTSGTRSAGKSERAEVVHRELDRVGMAAFAHRYPDTLSGGQQQRVGLARALAPAPRVMLLDEPFASIDATLRRELREVTRAVLKETGVTTIVVTHDPAEALELGDRIAFLSAGRLVQQGTPEEVWSKPATPGVAMAFGEAQPIPVEWRNGGLETPFGRVPSASVRVGGPLPQVLARPEALQLTPGGDGRVRIVDLRYLGGRSLAHIECAGRRYRAVLAAATRLTVGSPVQVTLAVDGCLIFPEG